MQKPYSYYLALAPDKVDMNDPEVPESVKIRARNALEKQEQDRRRENAETDQK